MRRKQVRAKKLRWAAVSACLVIVLVVVVAFYRFQAPAAKPVILYVDQGNGAVNGSNFGSMLAFASSEGFNTVFFQVYREGVLLFNTPQLGSFVNQSHARGLKLFFALYFTNSSQALPVAIFNLGEDGISLDASGLSIASQEALLQGLGSCRCTTAVTTTDMASPLKPDLLVLETYGTSYNSYIRGGIIASVGVFAISSQSEYESQFQYALHNSDGVMVFDYAGLLKSGY